ncbi:MAG: hypothetical protein KJO53_13680 [Eudoraea sp.]|nr:hypothetical protein [Eudoraea sp.]
MRTLFFVTVFICTGFVSFAQDKDLEKQIITTEKGLALTSTKKAISLNTQNDQAGIYKYRNSKIKRALAFATNRDRPKLA